jgi:hypothetical protein
MDSLMQDARDPRMVRVRFALKSSTPARVGLYRSLVLLVTSTKIKLAGPEDDFVQGYHDAVGPAHDTAVRRKNHEDLCMRTLMRYSQQKRHSCVVCCVESMRIRKLYNLLATRATSLLTMVG